MAMNKEQKNHLKRILKDTNKELADKYKKGAAEHKTVLSIDYSMIELMDMLIEEVIDLTTYAHTLREKLRELTEER